MLPEMLFAFGTNLLDHYTTIRNLVLRWRKSSAWMQRSI